MNRRTLSSLPQPPSPRASGKRRRRKSWFYTSVDDVFARPIGELFQKQSGIAVKLVPDTEETKSTGLLNRLIAEKAKPVADLFWSGDPMRAAVLKSKGISQPSFTGGGLFRKGLWGDRVTQTDPEMTKSVEQASDHAAVFTELNI